MLSPLQLIRRVKEARAEEVRRLAENPEDSSSGKRFKQLYKVGEKLGQGAFAVVKEATHRQSGQSFAIKIVNKNHLNDKDAAALQDEIDVLRHLRHPHIVELYDVFNGTDYYYLVTEKINGGNLYDRIARKGQYDEVEGRLACKTLLEAVAFTHKHSVAHRDLKLENLLLVNDHNDHNIKIIDFGFAKRVTSPNGLHTFIGTPAYVAPCILEGVGYGTKADVWALGVIVFCMLSGTPPFQDRDQQNLFRKIRKGKYEFVPEKWSHVSDQAKDVIRHMLTVDPAKRVAAREALELDWFNPNSLDLSHPDMENPADPVHDSELDDIRKTDNQSPVSTLHIGEPSYTV